MAIRTCEVCGTVFQSEGHTLDEWLSLCHRCNINRKTLNSEHIEKKIKKNRRLPIFKSEEVKINLLRANFGGIFK